MRKLQLTNTAHRGSTSSPAPILLFFLVSHAHAPQQKVTTPSTPARPGLPCASSRRSYHVPDTWMGPVQLQTRRANSWNEIGRGCSGCGEISGTGKRVPGGLHSDSAPKWLTPRSGNGRRTDAASSKAGERERESKSGPPKPRSRASVYFGRLRPPRLFAFCFRWFVGRARTRTRRYMCTINIGGGHGASSRCHRSGWLGIELSSLHSEREIVQKRKS
jgi:hypothetical protein